MEHAQNALDQEEQRAPAIIDEYYESLRADQTRREASRNAERIAKRKRSAIFADQIHRWNEICRLNEQKYMVEIKELV